MKYFIMPVLVVLSMTGCEPIQPQVSPYGIDQCARHEFFQQCLSTVPQGPHVVGDDNAWDEIISQCDSAAWRAAYRQKKFIKPECLGQ